MFPDLFSIGPLVIHSYGVLVAAGLCAALLTAVKTGKAAGISSQRIMDMAFIMVLAGLTGSRATYVLMNLDFYMRNPLDVVKIWEGGLVFSGAILTVVPTIFWFAKKHKLSLWEVGDVWAPAAAIGQGIGRIGCLMAGCCYGRPTDAWWSIVFTHPNSLAPKNVPLHPTQIYSSLSGFGIFAVLWVLHSRKQFRGQVFLWFLILHSTARLAIERFRGDDRGLLLTTDMTLTQLITLLILAAAVATLLWRKTKERTA
jgi:phosphatidylglycerol:prolipoprotein diacylglycerol transferase